MDSNNVINYYDINFKNFQNSCNMITKTLIFFKKKSISKSMITLLPKKNFNVIVNDVTNCSCTSFGNIFISKIF